MATTSLQLSHDPTLLFLLIQEAAHKTARGTSPPAHLLIFHLHEGQMDAVGLWHLCPHLGMEQIHQAPRCLHPVHPRRSYTSYHINQHQTNYIFCPNISARKALPAMTDAGTHRCALAPGVSALDVRPPAVTTR